MSRQRVRDTAPEIALRRELHRRGLRFRLHERPVQQLRRNADIVFRGPRVAVFVDGCFWHGCPEHGRVPSPNAWYWPAKFERNRARDADTAERLSDAGWRVVRVWEHEETCTAATRVECVVNGRRRRVAD